ncbi:MAG: hypothetical protein WHS46_01365 [Desulfosoma sp.]
MDRPFRILVTDRNRHVRAFLRRELTQDGYEVMEAGDCREVQKILRSPVIVDLLVFDPDIAWESHRLILRNLRERYPSMRVVLHSLWDDACLVQHVHAAVSKTGSLKELKEVVSRLLAPEVLEDPTKPNSCEGSWPQSRDKEGERNDHGG